jgi:hypothetical protein
LAFVFLGQALVSCAEEKVNRITPEIAIDQPLLDFGAVRQGNSAELKLKIRCQSQTPLTIRALLVEDEASAPGGASRFAVAEKVEVVPAEGEAFVTLRFSPDTVAELEAALVVKSDDADPADAEKRVRLKGRGAVPVLRVLPECKGTCKDFTATEKPLALDFGLRPTLRKDVSGKVINEPGWPTVTLLNDGEIPLKLIKVAFEGDKAFSSKQSLSTGGVTIDQGSGQLFHVVFNPQNAAQASYQGELVIQTDDPAMGEARVKLAGKLAPNQPPLICAAIVEANQPDGSVDFPKDASGARSFGAFVPVQPGEKAKVFLSAFKDHFSFNHPSGVAQPPELTKGDLSQCTTDPEDGRSTLTYQWTVIERPAQSNPAVARLQGAQNPESSFKPDAIGRYKVQLDVKDPQGAAGKPAVVAFDAVPQRDIVAQLTWENQQNVDLDIHLVKPGPCGTKSDCIFDKQGDINGFMAKKTAGVFDWGEPAKGYDDPRLDFDDQGDKGLIENVNLNRPENDPACKSTPCVYDVYVHYFKDWRTDSGSAPKCPDISPQTPCKEGEPCGCSGTFSGPDSVCVSARCVKPVWPLVKIFIRPTPSKPDPVLTIPLFKGTPPPPPGNGEKLPIAGPCMLWHVARITWPSADEIAKDNNAAVSVTEVGNVNRRTFLYYGSLATNSFACAPNTPPGTSDPDVTYLPGTLPEYK